MNTQEYINELKLHLRKLDDEDREDAISYYFEYLAEAGPDGAADAMERLGSPAKLAAGIRADQAMQDFEEDPGRTKVRKGVRAVWLAGLAAVPRNLLAAFVTIIIIVVFFAVIIVLFATSCGLIAGGIAGLVSGALLAGIDGAMAMFYSGAGLAAGAGGFLLFIFSLWCAKHMLHGIAAVFNGIRRKRRRKQAAPVAAARPVAAPEPVAAAWPLAATGPIAAAGPVAATGPVVAVGPVAATEPIAATGPVAVSPVPVTAMKVPTAVTAEPAEVEPASAEPTAEPVTLTEPTAVTAEPVETEPAEAELTTINDEIIVNEGTSDSEAGYEEGVKQS